MMDHRDTHIIMIVCTISQEMRLVNQNYVRAMCQSKIKNTPEWTTKDHHYIKISQTSFDENWGDLVSKDERAFGQSLTNKSCLTDNYYTKERDSRKLSI